MSDETIVFMEDEGMEDNDVSAQDLADFDWSVYQPELVNLLPEGFNTTLQAVFTNKPYGWKKRARQVIKIHKQYKYLLRLVDELDQTLNAPRKLRKSTIDPREGLMAFLRTQTDLQITKLCVEYCVSYKSYMNAGDKLGLLEAIAEEMLSTSASE